MGISIGKTALASAILVASLGAATVAQAKPADCYTSDDGNYPCNFSGTDGSGSFRATQPGYPAITLEVESPGVAWVFKYIGGRNVALPGPYYRASDDGACWDNPDTGDRLCVW